MTMKPYELEKARTMRASHVVVPPLRMAGPMAVRAARARSPPVWPPAATLKAWAMWTE